MNEQCGDCGAELMAGQQFCRRCGARVPLTEADAPTRIFTEAQQQPPQPGMTTALFPRGTGEPPLVARPTEQHTPYGGPAYTSHLAPSLDPHAQVQQDSRRRLKPLLLTLLLVLGLGGLLAIGLISTGLLRGKIGSPRTTAGGSAAPAQSSAGVLLDDAGAIVSESETVLVKTYEVSADTAFSFNSQDGNLSVVGGDTDGVEIKVTKRGGTAEDRRNARVTLNQGEGLFALAAASSPVKVSFEVKLPRTARKVELSSGTANVTVSNVEAPLEVKVRNGSINLDDVRGPVQAKSINGHIDLRYRSASRKGAHELATVNGSINVRLVEGLAADLKASVVNGSIDVDSGLGFQPQKRQVGWQVEAQLGGGGEPLGLKTVNGTIKIQK